MGGSDVFVDFKIVMRKLTGLSSPNLVDSRHAEQSLVNLIFGIPPISIKTEQPKEVLITEADQARIRLATGIDEASLVMVRESLHDGVQQAVSEQLDIAASSGLKKAVIECSTQIVDDMKSFLASEKEEVRNLIASKMAKIRSIFGSEKEELKNLFTSERKAFVDELR